MCGQLDILIERFVQRAGTLYSLPAVAVKIVQLADDPQLDTHQLKECIENDPALTSRILRVVNSSLFGLSCPVADLGQALTLLGVKPLKLLVLGFSLPEGLYAGIAAEVLQWYWRRTLTKAVAARQLSEKLWRRPGDDAFLIGLLQDLGMLLLIQSLGQPYQEFVQRVRSLGKDLIAMEREVMGFDHTALTARLLEYWRLPEGIVRWVSWQELQQRLQAPATQTVGLAQAIHMAEGLTRVLADHQPEYLHQLLAPGATYRGLTQSQLEEIVTDLESKVAQLAEVLHLDLPPTEDHRTILLQAHRHLSEAAAEAVQMLLNRKVSSTLPEETSKALTPHMARLAEAVDRLTAGLSPGKNCSIVSGGIPISPKNQGTSQPARIPEKDQQIQAPETSAWMSSALAEGYLPTEGKPEQANQGGWPSPRLPPSGQPTPGHLAGLPRMEVLCSGGFSKPADGAKASATVRSPTAGHDLGLLSHLKATVAACRNARAPVSLLLAEPVERNELLIQYGPEGIKRFRSLLQAAAESIDHEGRILLPYGDWGVAVILPDCDRQEAVRLGNQLIAAMRRLGWSGGWRHRGGVALGVGVSSVDIPPKNFPAEELLEAAARCLFGSQASGGEVVKSIEIY
ncbi:MAG: HDOD domain-containing protein [Thermoguttaceae bacterium]|nr:HDOD domain-containing protein [Thermoguttaceae bacterium]MDW8037036.1 HDOD domain-containing protein [Thermoguttaceae bacterium]